MKISLLVVCVLSAVAVVNCCPAGWFKSGENCFFIIKEHQNWHEAQRSCKALDGTLALIENRDENEAVYRKLANLHISGAWLGLRKGGEDLNLYANGADTSFPGGAYGLVPGENLGWSIYGYKPVYTNWAPGEPNGGSDQNCVEIYNTGSECNQRERWNNLRCNWGHGAAVCSKPASTGCTASGWFKSGTNCFYIYKHRAHNLKWDDAYQVCKQLGATLAAINNEKENHAVYQQMAMLRISGAWIGLRRTGVYVYKRSLPRAEFSLRGNNLKGLLDGYGLAEGNVNEWSTYGYRPVYTNWAPGEPNGGSDQNCAEIYSTGDDCGNRGKWNNLRCNWGNYGAVCSRPASNSGCPSSWLKVGNNCFFVHEANNLKWVEAHYLCKATGGTLAFINNAEENHAVLQQMAMLRLSQAWIGIRRGGQHLFKRFIFNGGPGGGGFGIDIGIPGFGPRIGIGVGKNGIGAKAGVHLGDIGISKEAGIGAHGVHYKEKVGLGPLGKVEVGANVGPGGIGAHGKGHVGIPGVVGVHGNVGAHVGPGGIGANVGAGAHIGGVGINAGVGAGIGLHGIGIGAHLHLYGLKYGTSNGGWSFFGYQPVYTNWAPGEPNSGHGEHCVKMYQEHNRYGTWDDINCDTRLGASVCSKPAGADKPATTPKPTPAPTPAPTPEPGCTNVKCGANSKCSEATGKCECEPHYISEGGKCVCKDTAGDCLGISDYCNNAEYKGYMTQSCAKTCGFCGPKVTKQCSTSVDCAMNAICDVHTYQCKCKKYYSGDATKKCKRTVCKDVDDHCGYYKGQGYCTGEYAAWMADTCSTTCGLCD